MIAVRATVANETGRTSNPGCRMVRRGLDRLFALAGRRRIHTLPFGLWADKFEGLAPPREQRVRRAENFFTTGAAEMPTINLGEWCRIRDALASADAEFTDALDEADMLVVNGEGSLHHNFPRALALLAMMSIASRRRKPVALLNATIQAMSPEPLLEVLSALDFCHVRENRSLAEIRSFCGSAFVAPDLAVLGLKPTASPYRPRDVVDGRRCMVTSGVLASEKAMDQVLDGVVGCGFEPWYLSIGDGGETAAADQVCRSRDIPIVHAGEIDLERLLGLISRSSVAVSGRHHINIFLMRCGVPFVPLPSNTWKIEATLEMAGYPRLPAQRPSDLAEELTRVYDDRACLSDAAMGGYLALSAAVDELPRRFRQWS